MAFQYTSLHYHSTEILSQGEGHTPKWAAILDINGYKAVLVFCPVHHSRILLNQPQALNYPAKKACNWAAPLASTEYKNLHPEKTLYIQ